MADPITIAEKIACVTREIGFRARTYPRWISQNKITQIKADRELEVLGAVLEDLKAVAAIPAAIAGSPEDLVRIDERRRVLAVIQRRNSSVFLRVKALVERELGPT